ncbi:hypothetical protein [Mycolicibacterium sp. HK-90]|uniref:hypothetical protein n=1 Tax=Mycolicibacterium sp. HK-90 TaxID=3056937 RepID=UPI002657D7DE|nr:hypothetical protein [Mycolicibacterium sp. HK-90]WKG05152.1 hypothetical protein QU592_08730 [Mycolicibacterium sp. HK-90]
MTTTSAPTGGPEGVFGRVAEMIQTQRRRALVEQAVAELVWHLAGEDYVTECAEPPTADGNRTAA